MYSDQQVFASKVIRRDTYCSTLLCFLLKTLRCAKTIPYAKLSSSQHKIAALNLAWPLAMGVAVRQQSDV